MYASSIVHMFNPLIPTQDLKGPKDRYEAKYPVTAKLAKPVVARYLRFMPNDGGSSSKVMRAEVYGCKAEPLPPYDGEFALKLAWVDGTLVVRFRKSNAMSNRRLIRHREPRGSGTLCKVDISLNGHLSLSGHLS